MEEKMNHTKPKGGYVFMTYDEFQALAEVIAMAEGGVESADEDFAKYMRKHVRNANKLMVKFNSSIRIGVRAKASTLSLLSPMPKMSSK